MFTKYYGWHNFKDMLDSWQPIAENAIVPENDEQVLFASYFVDGYDGSAFVLFISNNLLLEVNGSHCSCFGLEHQWKPELTSVAALRKWDMRYCIDNDANALLYWNELLNQLQTKGF